MHDLEACRKDYPKTCYKCGGLLEGAPKSDKELEEMLEEHDRIFPGESIKTARVICDDCFNIYLPGGKKIGMN